MKYVIIGTAGHVDHGKTTLIQALTGTNPDRLKEEQERGMTIDLGFANLTLADGSAAGIVDVPGHEKFLKNMLAGAGGVDVALLVVAADEGVMPQTSEHLSILRILNVKQGVVALTKADAVDPEWLEMVTEDLRKQLEGTFLEGAPIVPVDSIRGSGLPALKRALQSAVSRTDVRDSSLPARLPVDRVFTRPGFGTVVTGTLVSGTLRTGDLLQIMPQQLSARVRGLQSHGKRVDMAEAGRRVAVNLAGVEVEDVERGALLTPPGLMSPTQLFDAAVQMLDSASVAVKDRSRVRIYLGAAEILARIRLLQADQLAPGEAGYAQIRAERPLACTRGDRFVLRTYSPMYTVGGGTVLDPHPLRHRRNNAAALAALASRERGGAQDIVGAWLAECDYGAAASAGSKACGLELQAVKDAMHSLVRSGEAVDLTDDRAIHTSALSRLRERAGTALDRFHTANPLRPGMSREELRGALGKGIDPRAFAAILERLHTEGVLQDSGTVVNRAGFAVKLNDRQGALLAKVEELYRQAGYCTPSLDEAASELKAPPDAVLALARVLQERGALLRIAEGMYYHSSAVEAAKVAVRAYISAHGAITVSEFRDTAGINRKFALQMMEFLDQQRVTRRLGDKRLLVE